MRRSRVLGARWVQLYDRRRVAGIVSEERLNLVTAGQPEQNRLRLIVHIDRVREPPGAEVLWDNYREDAIVPAGIEVRRLIVRASWVDLVIRSNGHFNLLSLVSISVAGQDCKRAVGVGIPALKGGCHRRAHGR